ncbi:MAG: S8 family serine peptidase, partial [Saprospiraceae bacterium]
MRLLLLYSFFLLIVFLPQHSYSQILNYRQGELIVWLKQGVELNSFINKQLSNKSIENYAINGSVLNNEWNIHLLQFDFSSLSENELLSSLKGHHEVLMVQKNHLLKDRKVPNDTYFNRQYQHLNDGSQGGKSGADFRSSQAWDITTGGITEEGDTIVACVIDGGLEFDHGDLKSNIWYNRAEIPGNGIDDDLNGYVDDYKGWNSYNNNDSIIENNHGTEVCGIVGGIGNNRVGVSGVNWLVKIMMVQGGGNEANAIISYAYPWKLRKEYNLSKGKKGAYVVSTNSSWGRDFGKADEAPIWCAMYDSLGSVGILSAGATANLDINVDEEGDLPTNCASEFLIGVTNLNWNDQKEKRAGYGIKSVEIGAYGEGIFTTTTGNTFAYFDGTSAACPQVAGAIALLYSAPCNNLVKLSKTDPASAALLAKDIILNNARKLTSLKGLVSSEAVLDLFSMLNAVVPIEATSELNKIIFKAIQTVTTPFILQYRIVGSSDWKEITINNTQDYIINDLPKCTAVEYRIKGICDRYKTNFSNPLVISTKGCCIAPEKIEIIEIGSDNIVLKFKDLNINSNFIYIINELGSNNYDTFEIKSYNEEILSINGLKQCSKYEIKLVNYCDEKLSIPSDIINIKTTGCDQCDDLDYCKRDRPSAEFEWLESVSIDGIYFDNGNNNGFADYTGTIHTWNLNKSMIHNIELSPGYSLDSSKVFMAAWIDWNHNSIFEESENILPKDYLTDKLSKFNFTIPSIAKIGITRMRIIVKYGENGLSAPMPCFSGIEFGEYEDYCVRIVDQTCSPLISVSELVKTNSSITFELVKANSSDVITYQYRKLPFGLWNEGRTFSNSLNLLKLDSCSRYLLILRNDCDFYASEETIINFNTLGAGCFIGTSNISNKEFVVYPNPFLNQINIDTKDVDWKQFNIYDLSGRLIKNETNKTNTKILHIEVDLNAGIYLLE